jgi:hypothetical protein
MTSIIDQEILSLKKTMNGWRISSTIFNVFGIVSQISSALLAFTSGYFSNDILSFASGGAGVFALGAMQFSTFSYQQAEASRANLNVLLATENQPSIPDFITKPIEEESTPH